MHPRTNADSFILCDNCDNLASKQLFESVGWNACGPCCFGEADSINDFDDPYRQGEAVYVEKES